MRSDHAHFLSLNAAIAKMQCEQFQTHERVTQMYNAGLEGSKQDSKEKASKKIYGKDGKVVYSPFMASLRRAVNKKNKKVAESVESAEYTELLESVLLALCEELELDPVALLEDFQTPEREQEMSGKRKKLEKRFETSAMLPKDSLGIWAHGKKDAAEKKSKQMYGKGGKIVKKAKQTP